MTASSALRKESKSIFDAPWLSRLPANWSKLPVRRICKLTTGAGDTQDAVPDGQYPFFVRSQTIERSDSYLFQGEGVLTSGDGAGVGKIYHHFSGKFNFHQRVYLFYDFDGILGRFFYYYLSELFGQYVWAGSAKSTVESLRRPMIQDFPVAVPPLAIQKAIANFLDRKTAAIDALIEKKVKLLELLAEKRSALTNEAMTKGLDPNVPMKDSGIPWIGEIPEHWETVALRRVVSRIDQGWSPQAEDRITEPGEAGVLKLSAINDGSFYVNEHKTLPADLRPRPELYIQKGDLLVTRANTPKLVGATCLVDCDAPSLMLSDLIYRLKTTRSIRSDFLCFYLQSSPGRSPIESDARGSSQSMVKISQGHIKAWPVVLPPRDEQKKIAVVLNSSVRKLKEISSSVRLQMDRLLEYRQSLITAAVTGQLEIPAEDYE